MTRKKSCLLIEDDQDDQQFFIDILQKISPETEVSVAENGREALYALQEGIKPEYIFTDISMPVMDGLEFLQQVKATPDFRNFPVIVYSSECSGKCLDRAVKLGAEAVLSKNKVGLLKEALTNYFSESSQSFIL